MYAVAERLIVARTYPLGYKNFAGLDPGGYKSVVLY